MVRNVKRRQQRKSIKKRRRSVPVVVKPEPTVWWKRYLKRAVFGLRGIVSLSIFALNLRRIMRGEYRNRGYEFDQRTFDEQRGRLYEEMLAAEIQRRRHLAYPGSYARIEYNP